MIARNIERRILHRRFSKGFILPDYAGFCLPNVVPAILSLFGVKTNRHTIKLGVQRPKKVVLFFADALGYEALLRHRTQDFFRQMVANGKVMPITTVFPSTTAAAVTSVNTGLTPLEHGLPEWFVYFRELDMILATLPFKPLIPSQKQALLRARHGPEILFRGRTIYQILSKAGVKSFVLVPISVADSAYSSMIYRGAIVVPYIGLSDMVVNLRTLLVKTKGRAYFHVYWPGVDSVSHEYGIGTGHRPAEISILGYALQSEFVEKVPAGVAKETLILLTADHGQITVNPNKVTYLNKFPKLVKSFQRGRKGRLILPAGSPRDVFLHIKPKNLVAMKNYLRKILRNKAEVFETRELLALGLLGLGKASRPVLDRYGNLIILPRGNNLVWYEHVKGRKFHFCGMHGGLTPKELLVPLGVARLSDLNK